MKELEILYEDEFMVAINKPHGLLVHRSKIATNTDVYALQLLRDQIQQRVYPVHRLDSKTSGVLLFAKSKEINAKIQLNWNSQHTNKKYLAIVRGYITEKGEIDYDLTNEKGKTQNAITRYQPIQQSEIPLPHGKFDTSRYTLIQVTPITGRFHQIRKHMAHLRHPIIGDRPHGCNKQNKLFKEKWNMNTMMLHASELELVHPITNEPMVIKAPFSERFQFTAALLHFNLLAL